ncbi:MAG: BLUF domain-containing protein [Burkholderiales bacterium]|nr:BLUF domain-containing protein [Pseudomonadota bacterium]MCC7068495.1 BLUF domain-containing protein [Burkholderiales bacterium]MCZ2134115.1 BLUF domain-containing protein [Burkholderiales bacterium]
MLVRLLYVSRAADGLSAAMIDEIVAQSRKNNPEAGLTGLLCHSGSIFMQVIEGGRPAVSATFARILRDPRHRDVELLVFEEISERRFAGWVMGRANLEKINRSLLLKYSEKAVFDPYAVSGSASMALLEELLATASIATCGG